MDLNRFVNDVLKPWDDLNVLLAQPYAFQPDLSDVTKLAGSLAVAIKHQADLAGLLPRGPIDTASPENSLMSDVADLWKHGSLRDPGRNNSIMVAAMFEFSPYLKFRFIRNGCFIQHATSGEHDFMQASLGAIRFWIHNHGWNLNWPGTIAEGPSEFHPVASLRYDPRYCISMKETRYRFFARTSDGSLVAADPPEFRIAIY